MATGCRVRFKLEPEPHIVKTPEVVRDPERRRIEEEGEREFVRLASIQAALRRQDPPEDLASAVQKQLEARLRKDEKIRDLKVAIALGESRIPRPQPKSKGQNGQNVLDSDKKRAFSEMVKRNCLSWEELVRLLRGESEQDPRPNKALDPVRYKRLLVGYPHLDWMIETALHGLDTQWRARDNGCGTRHKNHQSAIRYENAVRRSIREGQDGGQYIVLDLDLLERWKHVTTSPFSAVEKKDEDPNVVCRLVHDLSCPKDDSTNSDTVTDGLPVMCYRPAAEIALRIEELTKQYPGVRIMMMGGDVKGAYRHLMNRASQVHRMGGQLPGDDALIIDVSAPFGWTASPAYYGVFGGAITWLVTRESPTTMCSQELDAMPFFGYEWVDDHVMVEPDVG